MGYLVSPYSYANGTPGGLPVTMVSFILFILNLYVLQFPSPHGKYCKYTTCHTTHNDVIKKQQLSENLRKEISKAIESICTYTYKVDKICLNITDNHTYGPCTKARYLFYFVYQPNLTITIDRTIMKTRRTVPYQLTNVFTLILSHLQCQAIF